MLKVIDAVYKIAMALSAIVGIGSVIYSLMWTHKFLKSDEF